MKYLKNITTLRHDTDKCTACGMCINVCPHGVFEQRDGTIRIADRDSCMECGACEQNCPFEAVNVDKGVGCAAAIINSFFNGGEVSCC